MKESSARFARTFGGYALFFDDQLRAEFLFSGLANTLFHRLMLEGLSGISCGN